MNGMTVETSSTLWMVNDIPARMVYAGRRWRVTDTPTRLRENVWALPLDEPHNLYEWRFQATDDAGETFVFDVYRAEDDWHVHRLYA